MTVFCGLVHNQGTAVPLRDDLERIGNAIQRIPGDKVRSLSGPGFGVVWRPPFRGSLRAAHDGLARDGSLVVVGEVGVSEDKTITAIRSGESGALADIEGDFCFAAWDERQRLLTLARDVAGNGLPIYCHQGKDWLVFGNVLPALLTLPWVPREYDPVMVVNILVSHLRDVSRSWYRDVSRIPPATIARKHPGQSLETTPWWRPEQSVKVARHKSREDHWEGLREAFDRAVRARIPVDGSRLGIKMSGGLDSTIGAATVAGELAASGFELKAFTHVQPEAARSLRSPGRSFDEEPQLRAMEARYPNLRIRRIVSDDYDLVRHMDRVLALVQQPEYVLTGRDWHMNLLEAAAASGCHTLFDCTRGNQHLSWSGWPWLVANMTRGNAWSGLRHCWRFSNGSPALFLRTLHIRVLRELLPRELKAKLLKWRHDQIRFGERASWAAKPEALRNNNRFKPSDLPDLGVDPDALICRTQNIGPNFDIMSEMATLARAATGIRLIDLTGDRRLIEYCLSIPPEHFIGGGLTRIPARMAFLDRLPTEVAENPLTGVQDPGWEALLLRNEKTVRALLDRFETRPEIAQIVNLAAARDSLDSIRGTPLPAVANGTRGRRVSNALIAGRFIEWMRGGN